MHVDELDNLIFLNVQVYWVEEKMLSAGLKVSKLTTFYPRIFNALGGGGSEIVLTFYKF